MSAESRVSGPRQCRLPLRPELMNETAYGAPQPDVSVRLNVNENPYPPGAAVVDDIEYAIAEAAAGVNRYPDRDASALRSDLAAYLGHGLRQDQIWAANGSNEVLSQVFTAFAGPGRSALTFAPSYSMYPEYARNTFTRWETTTRRADFSIDVEHAVAAIAEQRPDVVIIANPNNPTGTWTPVNDLAAICDAAAGIVVVDEAYAEFASPNTRSALELLSQYPRLAVCRTMSKAFAFAGVRLGYLAAAPEFVAALQIVRLPYHLSDLTQAAARAALGHAAEMLGQVDQLRIERDRLVDWLTGRGLQVPASQANFVLFGRFADRHAVWQQLVERGVLIRETGPAGWLRASVGTPGEMAAFRSGLEEILPGAPRWETDD